MDKRLNQIQTGTLTESRMNEDFVFWLKTTGLNILLVILLIGCGYMGVHWWQRTKSQTRADAWRKLDRATTPQDLALVVTEANGVDSVAYIARIRAAHTYLDAITSGRRFDRDEGAEDAQVTPELRTEWLSNADQLFLEVADELTAPGTPVALQPMAFHALVGRAAIAESRGDAAAAKKFLDEAAALVSTSFPALAEVAKQRAEGVDRAALSIELPPLSALPEGSRPAVSPQLPFTMPDIPGVRITPMDPNATPPVTPAMPSMPPAVPPPVQSAP